MFLLNKLILSIDHVQRKELGAPREGEIERVLKEEYMNANI